MSSSEILLALLGPIAAVLIFFFARRRRAPTALAIVAGLDVLCGIETGLLGGAHLAAVVARALSGKGVRGATAFAYDFRFYSLVLLGVVIVIPALLCVISAGGLIRGELPAWKRAFWSSVSLLAINVPLTPIQVSAYALAGLALVNLAGLLANRKRFESAASGRTSVLRQLPVEW